MDDLAADLLWLGTEDFTGLWSAAFQAQASEGITLLGTARDKARAVLDSLLASGLIDLYLFQGLPQNDALPVPPELGSALLHDDERWTVPEEEDDASVWYATTEKGFERYRVLLRPWMATAVAERATTAAEQHTLTPHQTALAVEAAVDHHAAHAKIRGDAPVDDPWALPQRDQTAAERTAWLAGVAAALTRSPIVHSGDDQHGQPRPTSTDRRMTDA